MGNNPNNNNNNNRQRLGNIINRVFESAGPDGKVRGTPQQIIDKYQGLARDAQLSGDRVAAESFLQHSEHYSRMLGEAQAQANEARPPFERDDGSREDGFRGDGRPDSGRQDNGRADAARQDGRQDDAPRGESRQDTGRDDDFSDRRRPAPEGQPQPQPQPAIASSMATIDPEDDDGGPIDTPESGAVTPDSRSAPEPVAHANGARHAAVAEAAPDAAAEPDKPKRARTRRKARPEGDAPGAPGE